MRKLGKIASLGLMRPRDVGALKALFDVVLIRNRIPQFRR